MKYASNFSGAGGTVAEAPTIPLFLGMTKAGDNISGFQSADGTT
jgi:hypothetical protein